MELPTEVRDVVDSGDESNCSRDLSDGSEEEEVFPRRSNRVRKPKRVFTYNRIGKGPSVVCIRCIRGVFEDVG